MLDVKLFIFKDAVLSLKVQQNLYRLEEYLASEECKPKNILVFIESLSLPLVLDQNILTFNHQVRLEVLKFQELIRKYNLNVICCSRSLLEFGYKEEWVILPEDNIGVHDLFNPNKYCINEVVN